MNYKKANLAYLLMILSTLVLVFVLSVVYLVSGKEPSVVGSNVLCEMVVLIPALAVAFFCGENIKVLIPLHRIKVSSALLTLLYVILLFPLVTLLNAFSMLFVENAMSQISDEVLAMPMWVMVLSMGIFGPFVEEIVFRGILLQTYQRTGRIVASIILSSVLFGMMHMNFNQFIYGAGMGVMLALLVEATGSVLTSFIAHAFFNTIEVVGLFLSKDSVGKETSKLTDQLQMLSDVVLYAELAVLTVIFTCLAMLVVSKIAKIEKRDAFFVNIIKTKKEGPRLISASLIVAIIIAVLYMVLTAVIDKIL
jgi:membrane protease YdiL (CAAX protease family)